jgi:2,3-dihydroxyphenylpropionate 1,2-dioxygenase
MPPFFIGATAYAIGDFGTAKGDLLVPADLAEAAARFVLDAGVDVALSHKMQVDHGFAQPFGGFVGRDKPGTRNSGIYKLGCGAITIL